MLAAAGERSGTTLINVYSDLCGCSVLKEAGGSAVDGIATRLPRVRIDGLCDDRSLVGPYLIRVDLQGAELSVLEGARKTLGETEMVILEVSLSQLYMKGPQFHGVVACMKDRGFVVNDLFGALCRPFHGPLGHIDVPFVQENGHFSTSHFYRQRREGTA